MSRSSLSLSILVSAVTAFALFVAMGRYAAYEHAAQGIARAINKHLYGDGPGRANANSPREWMRS